MSSRARKITSSEWERHRATIVELYGQKTLKELHAEMLTRHHFDASLSQYETQLKRWGIRKNATRVEWQHFFTNEDPSIPNSLGVPGGTFPPVILNKTAQSRKRARRWCIVAPDAVPTTQASGPIPPGNENVPVLSLIESGIQPDIQDLLQSVPDESHSFESFQLLNVPNSTLNFTHSLRGSPSEIFADVPSTPEYSSGSSLTLSEILERQSPFYGLGHSDLAAFPGMGSPVGNNTAILKRIVQMLPFAQLERRILSSRIMHERSAGHTIFGGFATRVVADIFNPTSQSVTRQAPDLQRSLRMLCAHIPGENSALVTDDQAFETKFARLLLLSMLNGFAGLDDMPMANILRFLNRVLVNKLLLDILEQSPRYVSRTLADNIFRAAIEATDTKVVKLLLDCRLVDVNETICFHKTGLYTPIERASTLRSLNLMRLLIAADADVNKYHAIPLGRNMGGALSALLRPKLPFTQEVSRIDKLSTASSQSIEAVKVLVAAGARVHPEMIILEHNPQATEINNLISQNILPQDHREFFKPHANSGQLQKIAIFLDDHHATKFIRNLIDLCHQAGCNKCLGEFGDILGGIVVPAASAGKLGLVELLVRELDIKPDLSRVFLAAIESKNSAMIDFILSLGPDLDPPSIGDGFVPSLKYTTPISEAVRCGNEDLIVLLEAAGCLDRLTAGNRFLALVSAVAEAGNAAYMRKLLALAGTSKQAYRVTQHALVSAFLGDHLDMAQMLLEAGVIVSSPLPPGRRDLNWPAKAILRDRQMVHNMIASGADEFFFDTRHDFRDLGDIDWSIAADLVNEYPRSGFYFIVKGLPTLLRKCIETDTVACFKEANQKSNPGIRSLNAFLAVAVEVGHIDLIEYLLDMGANPFHDSVLQAAIPDKPDMLRLLLQKERRRQIIPKCIGAHLLKSVMSNSAGNAEALDELIETNAIDFERLEDLESGRMRNILDVTMLTPLGMAIQGVPGKSGTNVAAMKQFLDAGANYNGISKLTRQWTKGSPLMTALMVAIETGLEDAVNILLDYGADVNARPRIRTTRTALQFAAELGNMDMVRLLLSRDANVNSSASPRGGAIALQFAAMCGNCNMVAYLLDHGAQLDALPSRIDGMWPLEGAAANGRLDMIRFLWELKVRAEGEWEFPKGFSERQCLRAMNFARENGHMGCRDLISELSGISVDRLETDEYGAPWIAY